MSSETASVFSLIEEFRRTTDLQKMEIIADELGRAGDRQAIDILLYRVGDMQVQEDGDVQDAVCGALVKLGVMRQIGNLSFVIESDEKLSAEAKAMINKHKMVIPRKYLLK
jgi:hypothetical protein